MDTPLSEMLGGDVDEAFDYSAGLGGDTGRGLLPNIPGTVTVGQDYEQLMQPAPQTYGQDDLNEYGRTVLELPSGAPAIHQLSQLAGRYTPEDTLINGGKGRQVGANILRRQMNESKDQGWMREPLYNDYIKSLGLNPGRNDSWDTDLKRLYGV